MRLPLSFFAWSRHLAACLLWLIGVQAQAVTVVYDANTDWTGYNTVGAIWSYYTAPNPVTISPGRPSALMGPTIPSGLPSSSFGNFDEGRVACCVFTVQSSFSQGVYVRFTNPAPAQLSLFYELVPVNSKPPDQQAYIFSANSQVYQGGGPVTLDLGVQPAGAFFEFAIGSLGCCGDRFHVTLQYTATPVPEPSVAFMLACGIAMLSLAVGARRVTSGLRPRTLGPAWSSSLVTMSRYPASD